MDKRIMKKSSVFLILLLTIFVGSWANAQAAQQPSSLIEPVLLKKWIDNGYRTEKGERVVIIDVVPGKESRESWFAGDLAKLRVQIAKKYGGDSPSYRLLVQQDQAGFLGHIPGALLNVSHGDLETMARSDGPMAADHEVGTGAAIDELLQGHGITHDDVIVITSSQQTPWMACPPRLWWTLYYWGFTPEKIKILNGGNKAYALAGYKLERGIAQPRVKPSKITVASLPTRHFEARVSLQEMIDLVDSGKTVNGSVVLLDVRQPPAAYYLKDERKSNGTPGSDGIPDIYQIPGFSYNQKDKSFTRTSDKQRFNLSQMLFSKEANDGKSARVIFSRAASRPITLPNEFMGIHSSGSALLAIPIGGRSGDFEGIIKGAHLIKSASYDLTVPAIAGKDNRFNSRDALRAVFAKAGIDGKKPIIIYCNAGALGSFYFYVLHEVCGFENIRMYDGSWQEWANLTAFEPADTTFVRHDVETVYPSWPAPAPSVLLFSRENRYLEWNGTQFVNDATALTATALQVKPGGTLKGNLRWDTLHRSEHIVFRPSAKVNDAEHFQTFNSDTDWPSVDTIPDYDGYGNEILTEDRSYGK
ncbi:MAG: rhodanese-like domain-containing protein [Nitrospiraceae bacterium]|nr:rhodanese-like domain-containing protein [Nitrospiraceae bacterium]MDA8424385.1 rhodanese-like domain-containing protein [Nitrospiraceae bacterium]